MNKDKINQLLIFFILLTIAAWMTFILGCIKEKNINTKEVFIIEYREYEEPIILYKNVTTESAEEFNRDELLRKEMEELDKIRDKKLYYERYWEIVEEFSDVYDPPERLEDYYTEEEIYLIERTVETEVHGGDFDSKCNVASVIFNRIEGDVFGNTVSSVIKPGQFCYSKTNIDEETALAVRYAYEIEDTTNGCLYFHSNQKTNTFSGADYLFTDNVGHHFYK